MAVFDLTREFTALPPPAQLAAKRLSTGRRVLLDADYADVATAIIAEIRIPVITQLRAELKEMGIDQETAAAQARQVLVKVEGV